MTKEQRPSGGRRALSEPPRGKRATRRKLNAIDALALLLLVGLSVTAALALAGSRADPSSVSTLSVGLSAEPKSLDPHVTTSLNDFRILANVYEGLVRFASGSLDVEPALAESWTTSADGKAYTFRLRQGVVFHDGTPFDAHAVKFNLERLLDDNHPQHGTGPFPLAFFFESVSAVRVVGSHTVTLELERPFAPLLSNLAYPVGFIVSPDAVRRYGAEFGRQGGGTGPFRVERWEGSRGVVLERFDRYWDGRAKLERILFRPVTDRMTRVAELRRGSLDLVPEIGADNVDFFRRSGDFAVHQSVGPHLWFLILNARRPPFDDVRMRRAVNLAVDRAALVRRVLAGTASTAAGAIPDAFAWARDPSVVPYPFDPRRAERLVDEAGQRGTEITCLVPKGGSGMLEPELMATAIQADLERVGLRMRIETYEWNAYLARVNPGLGDDQHMAAMAWMTNDPDTLPYLALRTGAQPPGGFNSGWYENSSVDRLVEAARVTNDPTQRARLYRELDRLVHADAPWLFVASWKQAAVTRSNVSGFELEPSFFLNLRRAEKR